MELKGKEKILLVFILDEILKLFFVNYIDYYFSCIEDKLSYKEILMVLFDLIIVN